MEMISWIRLQVETPVFLSGFFVYKEDFMDILKANTKKLFFHYLISALGSSIIMAIYSTVDTVVIGHYEGPNGTAAIAAFMPMWTIMFAFGLLFGIGGSVLMAHQRGAGNKNKSNKFYSSAIIGGILISLIIFIIYNLFSRQLIYMFGGRNEVLDLAVKYSYWISIFSPLFVIGQLLIPFIRNDGHPGYTTIAVLIGGVFNIFGDLFFVFICNMGIIGAGLATALGQVISFLFLFAYLFSKNNTLKFINLKFKEIINCFYKIIVMGASNFVIDIAMGILAIMFNNQIVKYLGSNALAVYGVVTSVATIIQTFGYAIGESAQAIMSVNYGAKKFERVQQVFKYGSITALLVGVLGFLSFELIPNTLVKIFMNATNDVLYIAPYIMKKYGFAFILLVFNVFCTYYFQSIGKPRISMLISLLRGIIINGVLIYLLPIIIGANAIWLSIPISETIVAIVIMLNIFNTRKLNVKNS